MPDEDTLLCVSRWLFLVHDFGIGESGLALSWCWDHCCLDLRLKHACVPKWWLQGRGSKCYSDGTEARLRKQ
jgi:hypothetical protein